MQIKRFEAQNMTEALRLIKQEFGSEAVILSASSLKKEKGIFGSMKKPGVEVTAAIDTFYPQTIKNNSLNKTWKTPENQSAQLDFKNLTKKKSLLNSIQGELKVIKNKFNPLVRRNRIPQNWTKGLSTLYQQMLSQGVGEDIASELVENIGRITSSKNTLKSEELKSCLIRILEEQGITASPIKVENGKQKIVAFIGPTGVGKTTTVAKLAAVQALQKRKRVGLITLDNYRIAAIEQLMIYAKIIGIPIEVASSNKELKESLEKLKNKDLVLIDTAGMSQRNEYQINELKGFFNKIPSIEFHLLLSVTTKEKDLMDVLERFRVIPISRLISTKLDESTTYGTIINQLLRTKIPISYFTTGQQVPEGIEIATLEKLVDLIINREKERRLWSGPIETLKDEDREEDNHNLHYKELYVANKNSDVFHHYNCKWVKKIKTKNMVVFKSGLEAVNKEFKPCRLCSPDLNRVEKYNPLSRAADN